MIQIPHQCLEAIIGSHTKRYIRMDDPKQKQVISHLQAKLLLVELLSSDFHASDNWRSGSPKVKFL